MITVDSSNRVFFSVLSDKDKTKFDAVIQSVNSSRSLGLTPTEMANYRQTYMVGVPFGGLKQLLALDPKEQGSLKQPGIPVMDSANNELVWWIGAAKTAFAGESLNYLIKGDGQSKYPTFEAVVSALKRNDEFKYNLVTSLDDVPSNSELEKANRRLSK